MYLLDNVLRPYAWGSETAIAHLLGRTPSGGPEAELWIGAHPDSPSSVLLNDGGREPLNSLIAADPGRALGDAARYGRLPFLLKVLAAGAPLSLQVHPTKAQAAAGYAAENASGIPADSPARNYRDNNHKPEMVFALTDFDALCGFRPAAEAAEVFDRLVDAVQGVNEECPPVLSGAAADLRNPAEPAALRGAFTRLISGGGETARAVELAARAVDTAPGAVSDADAATVRELSGHFPGDPGVLLALLLNRISLRPGQAVYLPAGNIHAYLRGLGIEVMASSDNVLRGGLTPKHVDVPELLRTVDFRSLGVPLLEPEHTGLDQELYRPPFEEFQLQRLELRPGPAASASMASSDIPLVQNGPALVLAVRGAIVLDSPRGDLLLRRGDSAFIPATEAPVMVKRASGTDDGGALAFAVTVAG